MTVPRLVCIAGAMLFASQGCEDAADTEWSAATESAREFSDDGSTTWRTDSTWLPDGSLVFEIEEIEDIDVTRLATDGFRFTFSSAGWLSISDVETGESVRIFRAPTGDYLVDGRAASRASFAAGLAADTGAGDYLDAETVGIAFDLMVNETVMGGAQRQYTQFLNALINEY